MVVRTFVFLLLIVCLCSVYAGRWGGGPPDFGYDDENPGMGPVKGAGRRHKRPGVGDDSDEEDERRMPWPATGNRFQMRSPFRKGDGNDDNDDEDKITGWGRGRRTGGPDGEQRGGDFARKRKPIVQWKPWQESECLWFDQIKDIPDSCKLDTLVRKLPPTVAEYYASKAFETFETTKKIFQDRGLTDQACGYCSRKIACRKQSNSGRKYFLPIQFAFVNEDCDNGDPCRLSAVDGACPAPIPQKQFAKYNLLFSAKRSLTKGEFQFNGRQLGNLDFPSFSDNDDGNDSNNDDSDDNDGNGNDDWASDDPLLLGGDNDNGTFTWNGTSTLPPMPDMAGIIVNGTGRGRPPMLFNTGLFQRYSYDIPLWRCVKDPAVDDKCLCCCGDFYPDPIIGQCIPVKNGNRYPPMDADMEARRSIQNPISHD